ncbi:ATP-binding cassette, subfamily B/ATP-binding cassette, subfamily B, MsbA [Paenibacillus sp. OK060]|uniref:ABC transporter ATP-binding protein n=1 Tax=Paenibacillus sp. OK060 TaxID=1881034 RepID=UPI00088288C8|nr:ABC transporter ATP-binding protein [Paenibacillus sp. OK060]SDM33308.1 ATP-binding cassette, subfamily B/ATP-binding cassette, subfamily B, MsbA [Paenibacillus sp. OK060]
MLQSLRWVVSYIAKVKRIYLLAMLLLVISVVTNLMITFTQKYIIDDVFLEKNYSLFPYLLGLFVFLAFSYIASWCFKDILFERASDRLRLMMRKEYMEFLYQMPADHYQKERVGSLLSYLNDLLNSKNTYIWGFPDLIERILNLILLLCIVGFTVPQLLFIIVPLSVLYIIQGKYFGSRISKLSIQRSNLKAEHNVNIEEGISASREVIAFHRIHWEINKIKQSAQNYIHKVFEIARIQRKQLVISEPMRWGSNLLILGYGGYMVLEGNLTIGTFVVFYQFSIQLLDAFQGTYNSIMQFSNDYGGIYKAQQLMSSKQMDPGEVSLTQPVKRISFKKVSFSYAEGEKQVLNGLTIEIPFGKKVAIVGESGSGKSTIAQLLLRLYSPTSGHIEINDIPIQKLKRETWAQKVNAVFQDPYLLPDSIRSNITLGRDFTEAELAEACRHAEIYENIVSLPDGFDTLLGERGVNLSGGQRQRIALARAIIGNPEVLILDEATSALDLETERRVQANIDLIRKEKTTIIIAHRLSTVENADICYSLAQDPLIANKVEVKG